MKLINLLDLYSGNYIKNNKLFLFGFVIFTFIYYCLEVIGIGYILSQLSNKINKKFLIYFISLSLILVVLTYIRGLLESKLSADITTFSRKKLFQALLKRYNTSFQDVNIGDSINRIFAVTLEFRFGFVDFFKMTLPSVFIMLLTASVILKLNFNIGILLFICLFIGAIITYKEYFNISYHKIEQEKHFYDSFNKMTDQVNNLLNSYINNETKNEQNKISNNQDEYKDRVFKSVNSENVINTSLMINLLIFLSLIVFYFYKYNVNDKVFFVVILIYFVSNYINYSKEVGILFSHLGISAGSADYFNDLLKNSENGNINNLSNGHIVFKNVSFSYKNKNNILNNLCLDIKNKSKVAIIGRSGSGKTTLTKLILKLYDNYDGNIFINNQNIKNINTEYLRKRIVYINQRTNLLERSVIDNINYGNNINNETIINLLNKYALIDIFNGLKNGINEKCLVGGSNLSLGMQKIIILTRGILKSKNGLIMIFDEPLAGLDSRTRQKVIKMIIDECKNKTLLIITHDKEILPYMNKIIDLQNINKK